MAGNWLTVKRGDNAPRFRGQCLDGDAVLAPVDLTGADARLIMRRSGKPPQELPLVVEDGPAGWVRRSWEAADLDSPGIVQAEVEVVFSDGRKQTFPADGYVTIEIVEDLNPTG